MGAREDWEDGSEADNTDPNTTTEHDHRARPPSTTTEHDHRTRQPTTEPNMTTEHDHTDIEHDNPSTTTGMY